MDADRQRSGGRGQHPPGSPGRRPPADGPAARGHSWRLVRADRDAVPTSVRRFMARARQRRLRAVLPWGVAAAVLAVGGLLAWIVYGTSLLAVRDVRVEGAAILPADQVSAAAAVRPGAPLATVDTDAVRARVQALAPVDHAVVSRSWPHTLVVHVVERTPVAAVPRGTGFLLIDRQGVPFDTVAQRPANLPLAQLADPSPADVNTRAALTVLRALTRPLRQQLAAISVPAPARIRLQLAHDRVVIWGDETESPTKAKVATALLARPGDTIDVSAPDVVTIK
jgi:cell division protein FtsQ